MPAEGPALAPEPVMAAELVRVPGQELAAAREPEQARASEAESELVRERANALVPAPASALASVAPLVRHLGTCFPSRHELGTHSIPSPSNNPLTPLRLTPKERIREAVSCTVLFGHGRGFAGARLRIFANEDLSLEEIEIFVKLRVNHATLSNWPTLIGDRE